MSFFCSEHSIDDVYAVWSPSRAQLFFVSVIKYLFLESIRLCIETNVLNVLYWGRTYFAHASISSDQRNVFLFDFLLGYYRTYGFVASLPHKNSSSHFSSHTIWVVCLYNVILSSWLGIIRHCFLWHFLISFVLTSFYCRMFCLNILQIFALHIELCVRIYVYLYWGWGGRLYPFD